MNMKSFLRRLFLPLASAMLLSPAAVGQDTVPNQTPMRVAPDTGPKTPELGPFRYDPSGNIIAIGNDQFTYDAIGRLVKASISRPDEPGLQQQTYEYDVYGNRVKVDTTVYSAESSTNRLSSAGATYDAAGNLTHWQPYGSAIGRDYVYDPLGMLTQEITFDRSATHIYTADDERLWTLEAFPGSTGQTVNISHWTVRDLSGKVLRDFVDDGGPWRLHREYYYRDGHLLAANTPTGIEHYSLDHLGTPRLVTNASRSISFRHTYFPFGREWTLTNDPSDGSTLRFTGHERDDDMHGQPAGTLDYMHARYYSATAGRFFSPDPIFGDLRRPQSFNRYAYALNDPARYVDPDGRQIRIALEYVYVPGDPTIIIRDQFNWSDFWTDFFWFSSGVANAFGSNALLGHGRQNLSIETYELGQFLGDGVSVVAGFYEINAGIGGTVGGLALDVTGAGAVIGIPAQVVSGALIAHGATTTAVATTHFMSGLKQRKPGKHGTFRGRDAKRQNDETFHRVVRDLDLTKREASRLHREIGAAGEEMTYSDIYAEAISLFPRLSR